MSSLKNAFLTEKITVRIGDISDVVSIQQIAEKTWPVAYAEVITPSQIRYMLNKMYSLQALTDQLKSGHIFLLAERENEKIGFAGFEINCNNTRKTKLHKLYVLPEMQGKNAGRLLTEKVAEIARSKNQESVYLNVNRNNIAQDFYRKLGFEITETVDLDIGSGFYMNDYIMELNL